jgi:hypothetical protein
MIMRIDFSSTVATAVVTVAVSYTLWWQFRKLRQPAESVTTVPTERQDDKINVHEICERDESGREQKWASKASIVIHKTESKECTNGSISCSTPTMATPGSNSRTTEEKDEPDLKELMKFKAKDIPDFTIELDDSDDDMF